MPDLVSLGKAILMLGVILAVLGGLLMAGGSLGFIGKLPGDISFQRGNLRVYFPLATMLLLSLILTLFMNIFFRR
jgi:hypothetical protein